MIYNEPHFLPIWLQHYGRGVGHANCYVIDHGSTDNSTEDVHGANRVRIPRSPMHDAKRARFVSNFVSSLLEWYDGVIYSDVDELLVPEPERYESLQDFCERAPYDTVTTFGLNVWHVPGEKPVAAGQHVLEQRHFVRFAYPMCKPLFSRVGLAWAPGFHTCNVPSAMGGLFLFHLHHYDLPVKMARLSKTRVMPWGDAIPEHYQLWTDEKYLEMYNAVVGLPREQHSLRPDDPFVLERSEPLNLLLRNPDQVRNFYLSIPPKDAALIEIPARLRSAITAQVPS